MYQVHIANHTSTTVTSYAAAGNVVKAAMRDTIASLRKPLPRGVYRSPKVTARMNVERSRTAAKLEASKLSLPKTASNVSESLPGLRFTILRK